mmetsp:Transcript_11112/g.24469  ORF Transcript_11112/g.24469 Transcript_11112/m.24469 type:complete len:381 (-) Transcript_11112:340-1482(-)
MVSYDVILRGGTIVDGYGGKPFVGDIGVKDGLIAAVSQGRLDGTAQEEMHVDGNVVAPGWVDVHTHLDAQSFSIELPAMVSQMNRGAERSYPLHFDPENDECSLFVTFSEKWARKPFRGVFEEYGEVKLAKVAYWHARWHGLVEYFKAGAQKKALEMFRGYCGISQVKAFDRNAPPTSTAVRGPAPFIPFREENSVFVSWAPPQWTDVDLKQFLSQFGVVLQARVIAKARILYFGEFSTQEEAEGSWGFHQYKNWTLSVQKNVPKSTRPVSQGHPGAGARESCVSGSRGASNPACAPCSLSPPSDTGDGESASDICSSSVATEDQDIGGRGDDRDERVSIAAERVLARVEKASITAERDQARATVTLLQIQLAQAQASRH